MPLIKTGQPTVDPFVHVSDDAPLPADGPIIVGLARWQEDRGLIEPRSAAVGVHLKPGDPVGQISGDLDRLTVVALEFPKFNDGRAMSQARLLRERHGYRGEIRATGKVLRDLLLFMHRCGFDAFEVADNVTAEVVTKSLAEFSAFYQSAADGEVSIVERRHGETAREAGSPSAKARTAACCDR